jgi:hypothetical protein
LSGYYLKKKVGTIEKKIIFIENGVYWFASKYATEESRVKSVRDLSEAAIHRRKFLIICGHDSDMNRFRELLSLQYARKQTEIKEIELRPLGNEDAN